MINFLSEALSTFKSEPEIIIETPKALSSNALVELCDATLETINSQNGFSIGFAKIYNTDKNMLEKYFKGVMLVPERQLIIAKFDGVIAGSIQLVKSHPSYETMSFACSVDNHFVVPWARGYGIAKKLLEFAENEARKLGYSVIKLSVRENRTAAISLYESKGYTKWGVLPKYEIVDGKIISGHFYYKEIA
ncbi:MAG: GNAT family N-acetyltransferase [Sphingobacteriia bacterium]|nr:GNAT family N-acetyltransferase [Sphingobacteriia bacterium]